MGYLKCYCRRRQFHQVQKAHQVKKENVFERPSEVETKKKERRKKFHMRLYEMQKQLTS